MMHQMAKTLYGKEKKINNISDPGCVEWFVVGQLLGMSFF